MALSRGQLDKATDHGCEIPGCDHDKHDTLYLHGRCHLGGRIEVSYRHNSGILRIACRECGALIAEVAVSF